MKLAIEVEYGDLRMVHVHDPPLARRELPDSRYRHPIRSFVQETGTD